MIPHAGGAISGRALRLRERLGTLGGAIVGNTLLNGATVVLNFVTALLLSHLLGASGFGAYSFATAWATLLAVPALLGLPSLVVREIATYHVHERWGHVRGVILRANQAVLVASLSIAALFAAISTALDWPNARFFAPTVLALPLVPLVAIATVRQNAMQGFGRVVLGRTAEGLAAPFATIVFILAFEVVLGNRLSASWAIVATVAGGSVATVLGIHLLRRSTPGRIRDALPVYETRTWARGALPLFGMTLMQTVNAQIGVIFVGSIASAGEAGVFGVANRAAGLVTFVLLAIVPTVMPRFAELNARRDGPGLQHAVTRSAQLAFVCSVPVTVVMLAFPRIVLSAFGGTFEHGDRSLQILCLGQVVNVATGLVGTVLIMIGRVGVVTIGVAVGTMANVALCVALIPSFGAEGAAIAASSGIAATNILMAGLLWRQEGILSIAVGRVRRT